MPKTKQGYQETNGAIQIKEIYIKYVKIHKKPEQRRHLKEI